MSGKLGHDRNKPTLWASEWTIPPTVTHLPSDNMSEISYSTEDEPGNTEVSDAKQRMCKLLEKQLYTDVTYQKSRRKSTISAHRAVLAVESPLFAKMLFDDHKDTAGMKMEVMGQCGNTEASDVKQRMCKLLEEQLYTDVTFYPKTVSRSTISAHRAVLAVGSPLFAKMLFDDNKQTAGMKMEVQISNIQFDAFSNIVKYLYTDDIFFESDPQVQDILVGAKQFQIQSLVDRCNSYFENQELTEQNVCSKLQMSITNKIDVLKDRCMIYIQENTHRIINSPGLLKLSPSTVRAICKLQSFNLRSEAQLLEGIMKWLHDQPPQNRRQMMEPIIKCIRLLNFTVTELGDILKKYPDLLTSEDGLKIMLYLYNPPKSPDFKSLPSWCNKNTVNRCSYVENPCVPQKGNFPPVQQVGKVIFPLKPSSQQNVTELTSLLQMKCVKGQHQINAIKLSFQGPVSDKSIIKRLSISVHVAPSGFNYRENIEVANSLEVRIPFARIIKARRGDLVDIEIEANTMQFYKFLQFDENLCVPPNPHFQCCVSSRPKVGKFYFISEVEYGPQDQTNVAANKGYKKRSKSVNPNNWGY